MPSIFKVSHAYHPVINMVNYNLNWHKIIYLIFQVIKKIKKKIVKNYTFTWDKSSNINPVLLLEKNIVDRVKSIFLLFPFHWHKKKYQRFCCLVDTGLLLLYILLVIWEGCFGSHKTILSFNDYMYNYTQQQPNFKLFRSVKINRITKNQFIIFGFGYLYHLLKYIRYNFEKGFIPTIALITKIVYTFKPNPIKLPVSHFTNTYTCMNNKFVFFFFKYIFFFLYQKSF